MSSENGDLTGQNILSPIMFTGQGLVLFDDTKRNKTIIDLARLARYYGRKTYFKSQLGSMLVLQAFLDIGLSRGNGHERDS